MEWSNEWISDRRYLDMTDLNKTCDPYHGATFLQNFLDLTVDFPDFLLFVGKFGSRQGDETYQDVFDLDSDGAIGFSDFLIFVCNFGKTVPLTVDRLNFPLRALHAAGHWGTNETVVYEWEANGRQGSLVSSDYIEWLKGLHVNWVGFIL